VRVKSGRGSNRVGFGPQTSSCRRSGAIARRAAILLSGTAAIAVDASPARAIVINDLVVGSEQAAAANYFDSTNAYPNVGSLRYLVNPPPDGFTFITSGCTGSLINARTILTAVHCLYDTTGQPKTNASGHPTDTTPEIFTGVSFRQEAVGAPGNAFSGFKGNLVFRNDTRAAQDYPAEKDLAVISLAQPLTNPAPVRLLMLQQGQAGFPTLGTTITMVGYGAYGTGSNPFIRWVPAVPNPLDPKNPEPSPVDIGTQFDNRRRVAMSSLGAYAPMSRIYEGSNVNQYFFFSQFRNPLSQNDPNFFSLPNPPLRFEGGTAPGDSGGPLFAMINGQLTQIGLVRGGQPVSIAYCRDKKESTATPCLPEDPRPEVGRLTRDGYGEFSDWTPINLFLQWIDQNNPQRDVTAAQGNFKWSNAAAWMDSVPGVTSAVPNNTVNYRDPEGDIVARYYNVTLSNPGTITLDMNPQIDNLSIMGAQSRLVIDAPYTLEVLLGTKLSDGTLTMAGGTLATSEFLMSGGLLTGYGTVVGSPNFQGPCGNNVCVTVTGGMVAPVGTLSIQGNYTQTGGRLQFQLAPSGANGLLGVSNTATLGGTLGAFVTPGLYDLWTRYSLLTAGEVKGEFAQFISSPPSAFLSLSGPFYTGTSVDVTLTRTPFGAVAGLNANQRAVGNALEGAYRTTLTGAAATLYTNLLMNGHTQFVVATLRRGHHGGAEHCLRHRPHVRLADDGSGGVLA
jgi:hypothetical protein